MQKIFLRRLLCGLMLYHYCCNLIVIRPIIIIILVLFMQVRVFALMFSVINVLLDLLIDCEVTELCPEGCSCVKRPYNQSFGVSCPSETLIGLPRHLPNPNEPPPRRGRFGLKLGVTLKMHDLKITDKENYGSGKCRTGK